MSKVIYDDNDDGKVNAADIADAVPTGAITDNMLSNDPNHIKARLSSHMAENTTEHENFESQLAENTTEHENFESQLAQKEQQILQLNATKANKSYVDTVEERITDIIQSADLDPNKDQEVVDARDGKETLGTKIRSVEDYSKKGLNLKIKNLVENGSFEKSTTGWTAAGSPGSGGNSSVTDENSVFGEKSLKITNNNGVRRYEQEINGIPGHKYFTSISFYVDYHESGGVAVVGFSENNHLPESRLSVSGEWQRIDRVYEPTVESIPIKVGSLNYATYSIFFDGLLFIDLTETFGAGNEPDAESFREMLDNNSNGWVDFEEPISTKTIYNDLTKKMNSYEGTISEFYQNMRNQLKPIVVICHDDGRATDYELYKMLQKKGMRATSFIVGTYIGNSGYLTEEQVKEMADAGYEIGCHSYNHNNLTNEDFPDGVINQILTNKRHIEAITGKPVETLSYPFGGNNEEVRNLVRSFYKGARTSASGRNEFGDTDNLYNMKTIWMDYGSWDVARVKGKIDEIINDIPYVLILSGHELASEPGGDAMTLSEMGEIADYLKSYQMQGALEVLTFSEAIDRIKSYPVAL